MGELAVIQSDTTDLATVHDEIDQYLTFYLQGEMFGLNIQPVKEISEYGKITPLPMVPSYIRGVVNLRGNVVPVIDLPVRFGWESSPVNKRTCIVIVELTDAEGASLEVGVIIDRVSEVIEIDAHDVGAAPSFGATVRTDFIHGMGRISDGFIVLLDAAKVLSIEELSKLEPLAASA